MPAARPLPLLRRALAGALVVGLALPALACGGSSSGAGASCARPVREAFDTRSLQHVLPGAPTPSYLTDPPTSGPHQPSPPVEGVVDRPVPPAQQVGVLERGQVLVQHTGLRPAEQQQLEALAGPSVVVAPADSLPGGARVVATAWLYKQSCSRLDVAAVRAFAHEHEGKGPGHG